MRNHRFFTLTVDISAGTVTIDMHVHVVEAFVTKVLSGCLAWATAFVKTVWDAFVQDCQQTHVNKSAGQQTSVWHQSNPYKLSIFPSESVTIGATLPGISKTYAGISMVRRCASAVFSPLAGVKMAEHLEIWRAIPLRFGPFWACPSWCLSRALSYKWAWETPKNGDKKTSIWVWTGKEQ